MSTDRPASDPLPLLDLKAGAQVLWRRRLLVGASVVAFAAVAGVYLAVTPPTYTATASIIVDPRQPRTTETDNVLPGLGSDSAAIASQVAVIGSRELLREVYEAEGLATNPEFTAGGLLGGAPSPAGAFERFLGSVGVEREGLTYVLDVSFSAHDPELAARIVNAVVARYIAGQVTQKAQANAEVSDLLKGRIAGLQQDVVAAERAVEAYKAAHAIYDSGTGTTLLQSQIEQLNTQLQTAQETARQAQIRYRQAVAAGTTPQGLISLTEILSSPSAEKLRDDYNAKATALASARMTLGSRHPTLVRLAAELKQVETLMVREVERITAELKADADVAQGVVAQIEGDVAALRTKADATNMAAVELRQLERNADASRQVLEQFQRRSEETSQFQNLQIADARMIAAATAPLRPTWPKAPLLLGVAAAIGLMVGAGLALLLGLPASAPARPRVSRRRRSLAATMRALRPTQRPRLTAAAPATAPAAAVAADAPAVMPTAAPEPTATTTPPVAAPARDTRPAETRPALAPALAAAPPPKRPATDDELRAAIAELRRNRAYAELT